MLHLSDNEIQLDIKNYERPEKRYNGDDESWANVQWKIKNNVIEFDSSSYDMESCEVDILKEMIKDFIDGKIEEIKTFIPLEPAFKIIFYPKGNEYVCWLKDRNSKEFSINPDIQLLINYIDDDGCIMDSYYSYFLEEREIKKFYNYLKDVTEKKEG